eukprot:scaffold395155_cov51-Prasinocladus_malaysianus.AAC.1
MIGCDNEDCPVGAASLRFAALQGFHLATAGKDNKRACLRGLGQQADIEWFHYPCAGISPDNVPDSWYCIECQKLKDQGKLEN